MSGGDTSGLLPFPGVNQYTGTSNYFIDATDHVTSFSHTWALSSLTELEHTGTIQFYLNYDMDVPKNVTHDLINLQNKSFYIEIWAGYETLSTCENSNFSRVPGFYKMFTGICQGGSISYEYGKNIMTCKVEDYSIMLKSIKFFNSPWFDGMKDILAIDQICGMAAFRNKGLYDPSYVLSRMASLSINGADWISGHYRVVIIG